MGKKNSRRLKLLFLVCAFIGLKVLSMAASYTSATIFNPASMKVTDQGSALIAVRLPSEEVCFPGNVARGQVVNNMGGSLYLSLNSAGRYTRVEIRPQELSAGRAADLSLTAPGESALFTGEILARWKNGSAEIPFSIDIRVIDPENLHVDWDGANVLVTNNSGYPLQVHVGHQSSVLRDNDSTLFARTGDVTTVVFSIDGQRTRTYSTSISTLLPPPQMAIPEEEPSTEIEGRPITTGVEDELNRDAVIDTVQPQIDQTTEKASTDEAEGATTIEANGDAAIETPNQINP